MDDKPGYPTFGTKEHWAEEVYRRAGDEPPWTRIWNDGEDVTDDPSRWPQTPTTKRAGRSRRH